MACTIASNAPLQALRRSIGAAEFCHSNLHAGCQHNLPPQQGLKASVGSVLGYCQAVFHQHPAMDPSRNTSSVIRMLEQANAPWPKSHELFWGNRPSEQTAQSYIDEACKPLLDSGRVPVIITGLDPAKDMDPIQEVLRVTPPTPQGETILLRLLLGTDKSFESALHILRQLEDEARRAKTMPRFWPLLQANDAIDSWRTLHSSPLGKYLNVAINPFTDSSFVQEFCQQIVVAQVPIGLAGDIQDDGTICLSKGMQISGATEGEEYNLFDYFKGLNSLEISPTIIVLGPAQPDWTEEQNLKRVAKTAYLLKKATDILWSKAPAERREKLLELVA